MPEISRFFGIVIGIFYDDHEPPYFHARYEGHKALIGIESPDGAPGEASAAGLRPGHGVGDTFIRRSFVRTGAGRGHENLSCPSRHWSESMLMDVVEVTPVEGYRLRLRFEDGTEGEVDVSRMVPFQGVFESLRDREEFLRVQVNRDLGTICWPNGADLDPDVLYAAVTGTKIDLGEPVGT